jgi:glutathione S-transferase
MIAWISLEQAIDAKGIRLILARFGVPSPWSEFCRAIFEIKRISYLPVDARDSEGTYRSLKPLTTQESVPVVLIDQERPRSCWLEQLYAAERLSSEPSLLPYDPKMRSLVVGLVAELCGEGGFGWCRRLQIIDRLLHKGATDRERQIGGYLAHKYGSRLRHDAEPQCEAIVSLLCNRLSEQRAAGRWVFVGEQVTAVDLAWAAFAALLRPLPESDCPMHPRWRDLYDWTPKSIDSEGVALLLAHRDRIYRELLTLPVPTQ